MYDIEQYLSFDSDEIYRNTTNRAGVAELYAYLGDTQNWGHHTHSGVYRVPAQLKMKVQILSELFARNNSAAVYFILFRLKF